VSRFAGAVDRIKGDVTRTVLFGATDSLTRGLGANPHTARQVAETTDTGVPLATSAYGFYQGGQALYSQLFLSNYQEMPVTQILSRTVEAFSQYGP